MTRVLSAHVRVAPVLRRVHAEGVQLLHQAGSQGCMVIMVQLLHPDFFKSRGVRATILEYTVYSSTCTVLQYSILKYCNTYSSTTRVRTRGRTRVPVACYSNMDSVLLPG